MSFSCRGASRTYDLAVGEIGHVWTLIALSFAGCLLVERVEFLVCFRAVRTLLEIGIVLVLFRDDSTSIDAL